MAKLNIDFLIKTPITNILENISYFFHELLHEIESYLNLELIYNKINISLKNEESNILGASDNIFSVGVDRSFSNDTLSIKIYSNFFQYIQFIMLREAYKCFIPNFANQEKGVDLFINQKVLIDLKKLKSSNEWDQLIRDKLVDYKFITAQNDRLENFLKQESIGDSDSPFKFFFKYIRRNIKIITEQQDSFYDAVFKEYIAVSSKSLYNDDIIETIRVLIIIFNKVQYYTAMLDYQHYFTTFKENGLIQTNLSLNKFAENMQWIKNSSSISPAYRVNWPSLNLYSINCVLKFNPIYKRSKITQIVKELPFFLMVKESRTCFGLEIDGFFVVPKQYFNDLKGFLEKLKNYGYALQIRVTIIKKAETFFNLNHIREYHNKKTFINEENKLYDKRYELYSVLDYGNGEYSEKLTLLDWLIVDRIRYFSLTGFNFERGSGTLKLLKADIINEVIGQRKLINNLKSNLLFVHSSLKLKELFLDFLKTNESFGFFYIKNILHKYIVFIDLIKEILSKNPSIDSKFKFLEHFKKQGVSFSIENNLIFLDSSLNKLIFNEFIPLYFSSKKSFEDNLNRFTNFYKIISSCNDLKIFNLQSIRTIVKNKSLINTIYKSKEEKLKGSYESYEQSELTYQLIERKLDRFLINQI